MPPHHHRFRLPRALMLVGLMAVAIGAQAADALRIEPLADVEVPFEQVRDVLGSTSAPRVAVTDRELRLAMLDPQRVLWQRSFAHPISGLAFHRPDGGKEQLVVGIGGLMAGPDDLAVVILDVATGRDVARLPGYGGPVASGGETLVATGYPGAARLRRAGEGFSAEPFFERPVETLAVSPDGATIALVDFNATGASAPGEQPRAIRLFHVDASAIEPGALLEAHEHDVVSLAFAGPDTLLSADHRGVVRVWSVSSGKHRILSEDFALSPREDTHAWRLSVSADSTWVAGDFSGDAVLHIEDGHAADTTAMTIRQGPGHTAFAGHAIAHVVKPPTFTTPVVRWWSFEGIAGQAHATPAEAEWRMLAPGDRGLPATVDDIDQLVRAIAPEAAPGDVELTVERNGERREVLLVVENLMDDSIAALRYRIELAPANGELRVDSMAEQVRCHPGRGNTQWSATPCH